MSDDDTRDAASSAAEHFGELIRILDDAEARATLLGDSVLIEGVARAKEAAERSKELMGKLRNNVSSGDEKSSC